MYLIGLIASVILLIFCITTILYYKIKYDDMSTISVIIACIGIYFGCLLTLVFAINLL